MFKENQPFCSLSLAIFHRMDLIRNGIKMPPTISIGIPLFPTTMRHASHDTADLVAFCMTHGIPHGATSNTDFGGFQSTPVFGQL
jgi:hypothetical protein